MTVNIWYDKIIIVKLYKQYNIFVWEKEGINMISRINNFKKFLVYMFCAFFSVCFSYLLVNILFNNAEYNYKKLGLSFYIFAAVYLLTYAYIRLRKIEEFLTRHYKKNLLSFLCIMFIVQMSFGLFLRFKPDFDIEAVYQGAIEWVQTGTFAKYYDYYYHFPNNLGAMTFLHFFFSIASFLGFEDYFLVGMIVNSILSILTMMVVSLILKHISGAKQAVFALVIFAVYLPFYFIAPVFYTDSLSMLFPVLFYYLYLKLKDTSYNKKFFLICILMGLAASIGMKIKFTVVIMVIAVAIDMFINSNWKKAISANAVVCSVILICFAVFNVYIYSYHLDRERARQDNDPYVHWVMMGLKGSGGYNPDDYLFTRSFKDPDERKAAIIQEIKRRISEYGPDGMFKFLTKKSVKCFGDGTFGLDDFLADREDKNVLHSFVISEGDKYELYRHICEAILFTLMLFMVLLALKYFFSKEKNIYLAPLVAVFGIFLFLLGWEANRRYFTNFVPVIIVCAVLGIDYFQLLVKKIWYIGFKDCEKKLGCII